jgi:hypothetical protein
MLRAIATWIARWKYVWNKETEAGLNEWSARVSEQKAQESRGLITKMKQEADDLEARIKHMTEMEEKGFWLCENGHEETQGREAEPKEGGQWVCKECFKPLKYVKRDLMTGQEKYDSDKDRKDAEKLLAARRQEITDKETEADQQGATAKYFRQQSESSRRLADSLRKL